MPGGEVQQPMLTVVDSCYTHVSCFAKDGVTWLNVLWL